MSDWLSWNSLYSYKKQFNQEMPFKTENCNSDLLTYCMSYSLKNVRAFTKVNKFFKAISDFFFFNLNSPWNKKSTYFINASYLSYCDLFITDFGFFPLFFYNSNSALFLQSNASLYSDLPPNISKSNSTANRLNSHPTFSIIGFIRTYITIQKYITTSVSSWL